MSAQGELIGQGEIRNNNKQAVGEPNGDANANEIQAEDEGNTGDAGTLPTLMSQTEEQDKIIIWGTDSQCDDPELAEFEMLECQELEAYLVEEGEEGEGLGAGNKLYDQPRCSTNKEPMADKSTNKEGRKTIQQGTSEQEATAYHVSGSRGTTECVARAEFSSETDVFVSCLSTMSSLGGRLANALDTAGRTQVTDFSWHIPSDPSQTISEDLTLASQSCTTISDRSRASQQAENPPFTSGKSTIQKGDVDLNQNTTILSEDVILEAQVSNGVGKCKGQMENVNGEHNQNLEQRYKLRNTVSLEGEGDHDAKASAGKAVHMCSADHKTTAERTHEEGPKTYAKHSQADDSPYMNHNPPKSGTKGIPSVESKALKKHVFLDKTLRKQGSFDQTLKKQGSFDHTLKKQASFENSRSSSPSSLERRKPWGSPRRPATPPSPKTTWSPQKRPTSSPAKVGTRAPSLECSDSPQRGPNALKQPSKVCVSSGIPKPLPPQQKTDPETRKSSPPQKPKHVRPKIITYIRKSPQVKPQVTEAPYEASYPSPPAQKDPKAAGHSKAYPVHCSSNLLYDKYRQEMQKASYYSPGMVVSGIKPPSHTIPHKLCEKSESFHGEIPDSYLHELGLTPPQLTPQEAFGLYRSPRSLRPQLGLGAVTRQPSAKTRILQTGQRSAMPLSHPAQTARVPTHCYQDLIADQRRLASETTHKFLLPKTGQSGLRPPNFSALPAARLATFGFVRSASVSSVSSNQSNESTHSDPCRPSHRPSSGSDADTPILRAAVPPSESPCPHSRSSPQPPNAPTLQRRSLLPPPRSSPVVSRKEIQRDAEMVRPLVSSPKRFAVVSPKPQSPVHSRGRSAVGRGAAHCDDGQQSECVLVKKLKERCEEQAQQLQSLQVQLKKASLGLEVFAITTQHFCQKSESAIVKERELSLELARIRDEVAFSVAHWERLQQDKEELERRFERELQGLQVQQQSELGALEERLRVQHCTETQRLQAQQYVELEELRDQQQEQIEEMSENHEEAMSEMETTHHDTLATLREEHARTVKNLKMAHEQQRKSLEEDFEKLRLSLQDQVDTLTFQNRGLRDRAKRFEEALRRSTDEQIVDALAPYQHIEEDLKSLKEVLEMKNQQIHGQEMKISELEKMAQKNVFLEERVQVLQQQNEDLRARIDKNLAMSRQLSEENANLHEHVEKESNEKKRLSRNNEELLWRLQTGELSPHMSPTSSPIHRASSGPGSPARPHSFPR